jgi:bacteriorhodopsin
VKDVATLGAGAHSRTTLEWVFYGLGFAAATVAAVYITRLARRALRGVVADNP